MFWCVVSFSISPCLLSKPLGIVPSAPTSIGITVTYVFHSFFSSQAKSKYLCVFLLSFIFTLWFIETAKSTRWQVFFLLINSRSDFLDKNGWSVYISKSQWILCLISWTYSGLGIYHLLVCSNFNFLRNFMWFTFLTQLFLVLSFFCASLL